MLAWRSHITDKQAAADEAALLTEEMYGFPNDGLGRVEKMTEPRFWAKIYGLAERGMMGPKDPNAMELIKGVEQDAIKRWKLEHKAKEVAFRLETRTWKSRLQQWGKPMKNESPSEMQVRIQKEAKATMQQAGWTVLIQILGGSGRPMDPGTAIDSLFGSMDEEDKKVLRVYLVETIQTVATAIGGAQAVSQAEQQLRHEKEQEREAREASCSAPPQGENLPPGGATMATPDGPPPAALTTEHAESILPMSFRGSDDTAISGLYTSHGFSVSNGKVQKRRQVHATAEPAVDFDASSEQRQHSMHQMLVDLVLLDSAEETHLETLAESAAKDYADTKTTTSMSAKIIQELTERAATSKKSKAPEDDDVVASNVWTGRERMDQIVVEVQQIRGVLSAKDDPAVERFFESFGSNTDASKLDIFQGSKAKRQFVRHLAARGETRRKMEEIGNELLHMQQELIHTKNAEEASSRVKMIQATVDAISDRRKTEREITQLVVGTLDADAEREEKTKKRDGLVKSIMHDFEETPSPEEPAAEAASTTGSPALASQWIENKRLDTSDDLREAVARGMQVIESREAAEEDRVAMQEELARGDLNDTSDRAVKRVLSHLQYALFNLKAENKPRVERLANHDRAAESLPARLAQLKNMQALAAELTADNVLWARRRQQSLADEADLDDNVSARPDPLDSTYKHRAGYERLLNAVYNLPGQKDSSLKIDGIVSENAQHRHRQRSTMDQIAYDLSTFDVATLELHKPVRNVEPASPDYLKRMIHNFPAPQATKLDLLAANLGSVIAPGARVAALARMDEIARDIADPSLWFGRENTASAVETAVETAVEADPKELPPTRSSQTYDDRIESEFATALSTRAPELEMGLATKAISGTANAQQDRAKLGSSDVMNLLKSHGLSMDAGSGSVKKRNRIALMQAAVNAISERHMMEQMLEQLILDELHDAPESEATPMAVNLEEYQRNRVQQAEKKDEIMSAILKMTTQSTLEAIAASKITTSTSITVTAPDMSQGTLTTGASTHQQPPA
jgi:hypothetical protein